MFPVQTPKGRSESPLLRMSPAFSSMVANKRGGRRLRIDLTKGEEHLNQTEHAQITDGFLCFLSFLTSDLVLVWMKIHHAAHAHSHFRDASFFAPPGWLLLFSSSIFLLPFSGSIRSLLIRSFLLIWIHTGPNCWLGSAKETGLNDVYKKCHRPPHSPGTVWPFCSPVHEHVCSPFLLLAFSAPPFPERSLQFLHFSRSTCPSFRRQQMLPTRLTWLTTRELRLESQESWLKSRCSQLRSCCDSDFLSRDKNFVARDSSLLSHDSNLVGHNLNFMGGNSNPVAAQISWVFDSNHLSRDSNLVGHNTNILSCDANLVATQISWVTIQISCVTTHKIWVAAHEICVKIWVKSRWSWLKS